MDVRWTFDKKKSFSWLPQSKYWCSNLVREFGSRIWFENLILDLGKADLKKNINLSCRQAVSIIALSMVRPQWEF